MTAAPFESLVEEYDDWFETNAGAYRAEKAALEDVLPEEFDHGRSIEVGVGTGRFAAPLGISVGIDPARQPLVRARSRGVDPVRGVAEFLPVADGALDLVAIVTVLSFVDDIERTLSETRRVLAADGTLVVAVLDRSTPVGRVYQEHKAENPFYADAEFLTADETEEALEQAGFAVDRRVQTIFEDPTSLEADSDEKPTVRDGHGTGLFAVFRAAPADS
ncbi:class I SAM-dependent methyltransferase [Natrarchaeobius chitinivorans]|uniref:Class I SAM-dependent methyltransferase n=1 Tax=Natrarchaeobius chitinivorans TaxID=1679083 RepID=A0A3N6M9J4_NATCH|nr:class I SAM-dependent methyltransferase [Natrarchaeobius chitinivorans]RQG92101.1 class I SAM-dependent methyltransferase [Natrarchaeobius chitinivorans]